MEAAVAGVGKAVLNCLLSGAKAAIDQDVATRQGIQRGLPFLTDELAEMQSFLSDADDERNKDKVPRSRVKYIRDLAYEVEDCLQDFVVHSEKPSWWGIPRARLEQHRIAEEMKGLRGRVEDMAQRKSRYRLVGDSSSEPDRPIIVSPEMFAIEQAVRDAMQRQQQQGK
ncbi:disease resistance protein PIK6-NP-like [Lolium perenne]|uniref:disease resistance protein PIK6-NP-like n=1 Tax=Lolium perenne TaxID=4522 RepID=UPI0021EAE6C3